MWEKTIAIGTVILVILTSVLVWQGFNRPQSALIWSVLALTIVGLIVAAALNVQAARIKHSSQPPAMAVVTRDDTEIGSLRGERETFRQDNGKLRDRVKELEDKLNQSLLLSGQFKGELDAVYADALLWWLKDVCAGTCSFSTVDAAKAVELSEEQARAGLRWLKENQVIEQLPMDGWSFVSAKVRATPGYRRFTTQQPWRGQSLRDKARQVAADLFTFVRELGKEPYVSPPSPKETGEEYLKRAYETTSPWVSAAVHGYEARFRQRVTQLYHELEAAGIHHDLREVDINESPKSAEQIRLIAETIFLATAKMDMEQLAKGTSPTS